MMVIEMVTILEAALVTVEAVGDGGDDGGVGRGANGDGGGCIQYMLTLKICGNRFSFGFAARTHCVDAQNATLGFIWAMLGCQQLFVSHCYL